MCVMYVGAEPDGMVASTELTNSTAADTKLSIAERHHDNYMQHERPCTSYMQC